MSDLPTPQYDAAALVADSSDSNSETDSAIGGLSYASSTTSARSDVYTAVEEFGRTYHGYKAGKYILPNDQQERDRLDLQHMIWLLLIDGGLNLAPIDEPKRVLDIATGTGIWAMDFAEQHPNSTVIGTDLSPIQPDYVPANLSFEIADAEDEWNFRRPFDYIHGRALLSCFTDPRAMIQNSFASLAPGGWLELQDGLFPFSFLDPQPPPDHPVRVFLHNALEASKLSGRPWDNVQHYRRWMVETGFVDVVEKHLPWACGTWPKGDKAKTLGMYGLEDLRQAVPPICLKLFVKVLGWELERVNRFVEEVVPLLGSKRLHLYVTTVWVYGRKPLEGETQTATATAS
ncbi:S-adenosyl-L-methionine-dependent methyltransferase [Massarina eburnea CBS 473.64]|uniref:S-adenosyl-L-methionine-dependent methyltransferase n=1 Tax=Massarina eburnea CBS 473.64 TaxID=1395130 RepID=A0A6A6SGB0_9PLEO|nr:S-adenosyl-L-methionine-dependent methyltransferase [Massarina eburnea CBS 473.64]